MKKTLLFVCAALLVSPIAASAQSPKVATYITDEEVKKINALPGVDRQIVSVDIGKLNEAVGIVHRGPTGGGAAGARGAGATGAEGARGAGGAPGAGRGAGAAAAAPCGETLPTPPPAGTATGISHDHQ